MSKAKTKSSTKLILVLILVVTAVSFYQGNENKKNKEATRIAEQQKKEAMRIDLEKNKEAVISKASAFIKENQPSEAIKHIQKYLIVNDQEISEIHSKAKSLVIIEKLKAIPTEQFKTNLDLYKELSKLNPSKDKYKNKIKFYEKRIEKNKQELALAKLEAQIPSWHSFESTDEMTGEKSHYTNSPKFLPNKTLPFPYRDVKATLGVGCDKKSQWAFIAFNSAPNLADTETESGYSRIKTRIKWDDTLSDLRLTQDWGSKTIHFTNDDMAIEKLMSSSKALLELQWHGNQPSLFNIPLKGSSRELTSITEKCAKL